MIYLTRIGTGGLRAPFSCEGQERSSKGRFKNRFKEDFSSRNNLLGTYVLAAIVPTSVRRKEVQ